MRLRKAPFALFAVGLMVLAIIVSMVAMDPSSLGGHVASDLTSLTDDTTQKAVFGMFWAGVGVLVILSAVTGYQTWSDGTRESASFRSLKTSNPY
jgi:hypothetical protein